MMAILIEHTAGKWPFWLSPRQCIVIPVSDKFNDYAKQVSYSSDLSTNYLQVSDRISQAGFYVDMDNASSRQLQKKILHAQMSQYNCILPYFIVFLQAHIFW
jgi:threonyl-tRNA synthetase